MSIDNPEVTPENTQELQKKALRDRASEVLGECLFSSEIDTILSDFDEKDIENFNKKIDMHLGRIDNLTDKNKLIVKAKLVGEMSMYGDLYQDRRDADLYRETEK